MFFHLSQLAKSGKIGFLLSGLLGFTLTEAFTDRWLVAAMATVVSGALGGLIASIPRIISARTESRKTTSDLHDREIANLIGHINATHAEERRILLQRLEDRANSNRLLRISKHNCLDECQRMQAELWKRELLLRDHEIPLPQPEFIGKTFHQLCAPEDNVMAKMVNNRIAEEENNRYQ